MTLSSKDLRKAQLLMLKILKEVHRVCEENNIHYFLSDGTLIGAVRHNGFIPWDDDADIGMLRDDYDRFCQVAPEKLGEEFVFQNEDTDEGYAFQFGKVILKGTKWMELVAVDSHRNFNGIYIDVFPYDKIPVNTSSQKKIRFHYRILSKLIYAKQHYYTKTVRGWQYKLRKYGATFVSRFLSIQWLFGQRKKLCTSFRNRTTDYVITKFGGNFYKNQNAPDAFNEFILHAFEDVQFYIPVQYDTILKNLYGDYMTPPPVEVQEKGHSILDYDFGEYVSLF